MNWIETVASEGGNSHFEGGKGVRHGQWIKQHDGGVINSKTETT